VQTEVQSNFRGAKLTAVVSENVKNIERPVQNLNAVNGLRWS
jgi:hypothetical protein